MASRIDNLVKISEQHNEALSNVAKDKNNTFTNKHRSFSFNIDDVGDVNFSDGVMHPKEAKELIKWLTYWYVDQDICESAS